MTTKQNVVSSRNNIMDKFFNVNSSDAEAKIYENYYDVEQTITTALASDPDDQDAAGYNQEQIYVSLTRRAEVLYVKNDEASDSNHNLFVVVSHQGGQHFSHETTIEPQKIKVYYNVYELRLRSATQGAAYKVSEYHLH